MGGFFSTVVIILLLCSIGAACPPLLLVVLLILFVASIADGTRYGKARPSVEELRTKYKEMEARKEVAKERRDEMFDRWGENLMYLYFHLKRFGKNVKWVWNKMG